MTTKILSLETKFGPILALLGFLITLFSHSIALLDKIADLDNVLFPERDLYKQKKATVNSP
jgi:hypothetical protein